ncbi:MAG: HEAT repeat domain-containing protein [Sandaracinaceae bacterium]|nr:HEAT repeat domain-containing protein [Sandaracinaceae bacterium]
MCATVAGLLVSGSSDGGAQADHAMMTRVLRESPDFRARVRAALALGATGDRSATPPLVAALSDSSPAVRAAACTSLARVGDRAALGPLRATLRDGSRVVRTEAERAIRRIEAGAPAAAAEHAPTAPPRALSRGGGGDVLPAITVVPRARDINWATVRHVVVLGAMQNRSGFEAQGLDQVFEREVMRNLIVLRGVATIPGGHVSPDTEREIQRRRLPRLRLEGSLNRVERRTQSRQLSVRCEVALMLMDDPGRNLRGVLNGAATGSQPQRGGQRDQQERQLAEQALSGAVRGAMTGVARAIASAAH